jgi:hypothetical protein
MKLSQLLIDVEVFRNVLDHLPKERKLYFIGVMLNPIDYSDISYQIDQSKAEISFVIEPSEETEQGKIDYITSRRSESERLASIQAAKLLGEDHDTQNN